MKRFMRKGFTLVEILIVIAVIGILASMIMLSSSESVSSANANNIISNLVNWKQAALMYYTDSLDVFNNPAKASLAGNEPKSADVIRYLANNKVTDNFEGYDIERATSSFPYEWYVKNTGGYLADPAVKQKLAARASSVGLKSTSDSTKTNDVYKDQNTVYLRVR